MARRFAGEGAPGIVRGTSCRVRLPKLSEEDPLLAVVVVVVIVVAVVPVVSPGAVEEPSRVEDGVMN